jgi:DNA-3-methyladenine glycosylase I
MSANQIARCSWSTSDQLLIDYHDNEWGVPVHDDRKLFEFIVLDSFQAGLSWLAVLKKREGLRRAFLNFEPQAVACMGDADVERLVQDASIIRHRSKIRASIGNARAFLQVQEEFGSFDCYIWRFVDGRPRINRYAFIKDLPPITPESVAMSKDLHARGFRFAGPTICYAFMQGAGMVNDHTTDCFRHAQLCPITG